MACVPLHDSECPLSRRASSTLPREVSSAATTIKAWWPFFEISLTAVKDGVRQHIPIASRFNAPQAFKDARIGSRKSFSVDLT